MFQSCYPESITQVLFHLWNQLACLIFFIDLLLWWKYDLTFHMRLMQQLPSLSLEFLWDILNYCFLSIVFCILSPTLMWPMLFFLVYLFFNGWLKILLGWILTLAFLRESIFCAIKIKLAHTGLWKVMGTITDSFCFCHFRSSNTF